MRQNKQKFLSGTCLAALAFVTSPAFAEVTANGAMSVSMQIYANCEIGSIGVLAFGQASSGAAPAEQAASFEMRCTADTPFNVGIDGGADASGASRMLTGSATGTKLPYELYKDPARTEPWGNDATTRLASSGTGSTQAFNVYGRVPDLSAAVPDSYTDNVTLSVSY